MTNRQNRRGFFKTLAGIVVGGAGAAVVVPNLKLQNKPGPAKITYAQLEREYQKTQVGGAYSRGDDLGRGEVMYFLKIPQFYISNPRMSARIHGIGA